MSKRSFSVFSVDEKARNGALSSILQNAEELLRAAQALKDELDGKRRQAEAASSLAAISSKMLPALEFFGNSPTMLSSKTARLDKQESKPEPIRIPPPVFLTPWTPSLIPATLPPVPPILDPVLEKAALTHSGYARAGEMSYERLEWIGDAYLYLLSTSFIYQTFPDLPTGKCAHLREILIKNLTLSRYTVEYHIHKQTRFPVEFDLHSGISGHTTPKTKMKALGDVFEAYVAAVILGDPKHGLENASAWIKALWGKELENDIKEEYRNRRKASPLPALQQLEGSNPQATQSKKTQDLNPKVVLAKAIGAKGIKISYHDEDIVKKDKHTGDPLFTVGVYLDGWGKTHFPMGFGCASGKKEAGAKAAQAALNNKKMMKELEQKRKEFLDAMEAQKEYENLTS